MIICPLCREPPSFRRRDEGCVFCPCRRLSVSVARNEAGEEGFQWDFRPDPRAAVGITVGGGMWPDEMVVIGLQRSALEAYRTVSPERDAAVAEFVNMALAQEILDS